MKIADDIDDIVTRLVLCVVRHTNAKTQLDDALHEERRLRQQLTELLKKIPVATPSEGAAVEET